MKKILVLITALTLALGASASNHKAKNGTNNSKQREIVLTDDNVLSLKSAFTSESVGKLIEQADKLNSRLPNGQPIYLFLRTPGGSIQAGLELFEYLKGLNRPVHTITLFAASMGFQTVQQLGTRYILKYGVLMSHLASGGFEGQFGNGIAEMDSRYGLWLRRIEMLDKDTVSRTKGKQTIKSYREAYRSELWLNGQEAVEQGYADEVVTAKCDASLEAKTEVISFQSLFFDVDVEFSKCPLKPRPISVNAKLQTNLGTMDLKDFVAKNPTFKSCDKIQEENDKTFQSDKHSPVVCVIDNTINISHIKKVMEEKSKIFSEDLRDKVFSTK